MANPLVRFSRTFNVSLPHKSRNLMSDNSVMMTNNYKPFLFYLIQRKIHFADLNAVVVTNRKIPVPVFRVPPVSPDIISSHRPLFFADFFFHISFHVEAMNLD